MPDDASTRSLRRLLRQVGRRTLVIRLAEKLGVVVSVASVALAVLTLVGEQGLFTGSSIWLLLLATFGTTTGWAFYRSPSQHDAALLLDATPGGDDLFSTALFAETNAAFSGAGGLSSQWRSTIVALAAARARIVDVRKVSVRRFSDRTWVGLLLSMAGGAAVVALTSSSPAGTEHDRRDVRADNAAGPINQMSRPVWTPTDPVRLSKSAGEPGDSESSRAAADSSAGDSSTPNEGGERSAGSDVHEHPDSQLASPAKAADADSGQAGRTAGNEGQGPGSSQTANARSSTSGPRPPEDRSVASRTSSQRLASGPKSSAVGGDDPGETDRTGAPGLPARGAGTSAPPAGPSIDRETVGTAAAPEPNTEGVATPASAYRDLVREYFRQDRP